MSIRACSKNYQSNPIPLAWILIGFAVSVGNLSGCRTVQVTKTKPPISVGNQTQRKTESIDGIPFYVKKAACKHEVVFLEPIYTLTLEDISADPKQQSNTLGSATISLSQYRADDQVVAFLKAFNDVGAKYDRVLNAWQLINKVPYTPTKFPENIADRLLVSNSNNPEIYVDYGETYYINAKRPLAGTAKVDSKFASDGTLTEASVEIESKTLETMLGPVNTAISSGLPLAGKSDEKPLVKHLKLTTEASGYTHTFSRIDPSSTFPCPVLSSDDIPAGKDPISTGKDSTSESKTSRLFNYTRASVAAASAADKKSKNKIKVSGEIVLPDPSKDSADKKDTPPK